MKTRLVQFVAFALASVAALAVFQCRNMTAASVQVSPGSVAEFASVRQGRAVLGRRDGFIRALSPLERAVRLQTNGVVTETQFLRYIQEQVLPWTAADIAAVTNALQSFAARTRDWNLVLPPTFYLVKTTGREEANSAYLRGSSIILPEQTLWAPAMPFAMAAKDGPGQTIRMVSGSQDQVAKVLFHELFHLYVYHNPQLRPALYGVLGFHLCNNVPLPAWLFERRITNPGLEPHDFFITVQSEGKDIPCVPVLYSKSTNYAGGKLFDYLASRLMALEPSADGYQPNLLPGGEPRLLSETEVAGYFEQIGRNTRYNIHPEETLADNFSLLVQGAEKVRTPEILTRLLKVIQPGKAAAQSRPGVKASPASKKAVI